ncbi:surfactin synthetase [Gammaproteobacteria bacterium]|nr:surfactin synthetase [Gammaproteobacteria bacterium]
MIISQADLLTGDLNRVVAWRGEKILYLLDFRKDIIALIEKLQTQNESRWALCCEDSYLFAVGLFALIYSGKTPVILGHLREALIKEQRASFQGIITDLDLNIDDCQTITLKTEADTDTDTDTDENLDLLINPDFILPKYPNHAHLILFTSGSTGHPKEIIKTLAQMEEESQILAQHFGEKLIGSMIAATISHQHLYGLSFRIFLPLALGLPFDARIIEYHEQLIPLTLNFNGLQKTLSLITSPAFLKRLDVNVQIIACQFIVSSGGALPFEISQKTLRCLGKLPTEIYGSSETGIIAQRTSQVEQQLWNELMPIKVTQGVGQLIKIKSPLFTEDSKDIIQDKIEIIYEKNQVLGFNLLGRKDKIIKIEEQRISLTNIETRLKSLEHVDDAIVLALSQGERIILGAVIVLNEEFFSQNINNMIDANLGAYFRKQLRAYLEPVALPKRWRFIKKLNYNEQSKLNYRELQGLFDEVC